MKPFPCLVALAVAVALLVPLPLAAQDTRERQPAAASTPVAAKPGPSGADASSEPRAGGKQAEAGPGRAPLGPIDRLPPDSVTRHVLELPGRTLRYTATAGSLPLLDPRGKLLVEIAYVAYTLDGQAPEKRPITFAFNGGPGASSAYLHLGLMGPKRLSFGNQGDVPSSPPALHNNAETWLDFTDLVFIDPVGTGFSRFIDPSDDTRKQFWSVDGDARSLARIVAKYLARAGRLSSPVYLVGESYGGFRVPRIAHLLQTSEGVGVSGQVLISPVLDFGLRSEAPTAILPDAMLLPSMAAARLEQQGRLTPEAMAAIEAYAAGPYLTDLVRGPRDREAVERIVGRVTELTGLDRGLVERLGGRVDPGTFAREFYRGKDRVGSAYDVLVSSPDPEPNAYRSRYEDPVLDGSIAPLTSAAVDYLDRTLGWRPDGRFHLLNEDTNRRWDWGGGLKPPEVVGSLRSSLALDPTMRLLVVHGYTDLVTPYFQTKLVLDQLPRIGDAGRVRFEAYPGGHMFYSREASRVRLRDSARTLYERPGGKAP